MSLADAGVATSVLIGVGSGEAYYAVSSRRRTAWGWVMAGIGDGVAGLAGGAEDVLARQAGAGLVERFASVYTARAAASGVVYAAQHLEGSPDVGGALRGMQLSGDRAFSIPAAILLSRLGLAGG